MTRPRALLATLAVLALLVPALAAAEPPNPPRNLQIGELPGDCERPSPSTACLNGVIYYLDQARATMGLGPYDLPANFLGKSPAQQMFILSDLDRVAYSLPPIEGLNSGLDAAAMRGVHEDADPEPTDADLGQPLSGFASNWAGGYNSTLAAYFEWMYDDGYESANLDCTTPTDSGCWGHRQDILWAAPEPGSYLYSMGAAAGSDSSGTPSYALIVALSNPATPPPFYYTWAQAVAEGAGTNPYPATLPGEAEVTLTVAFRGKGRVLAEGLSCRHRCARQVPAEEPLTLRAVPAPGYRLAGWHGCSSRRRSACVVALEGDQTVHVAFARRRTHRR